MTTVLRRSLWVIALAMLIGAQKIMGEDSDQTLSNKEIRKRLDILSNEVSLLMDDVRTLRNGKCPDTIDSTDKNEPKTPATSRQIRILLVSRESQLDGRVKFKVRYETSPISGGSVLHRWMYFQKYTYTEIAEVAAGPDTTLPPHVNESSIILHVGNDSHLMFMFGSFRQSVFLYIRTDSTQDDAQTNVALPVFITDPEREFVYDRGQNFSFMFTVPPEQKRGDPGEMFPRDNFHASYALIRPGEKELKTASNSDITSTFIHKKEEKQFLDKIEMEVELNTEEYPYSGVMTLTAGVNNDAGIVGRVEIFKEVIVRPSDQRGAFPAGEIYYKTYGVDTKLETGEFQQFCSYGELCRGYCEFFGDDLEDITLRKTVNGVTYEQAMETYKDDTGRNYHVYGNYEMTPDPNLDLRPVTYTCEASNKLGRVLAIRRKFEFGYEVKILRNESHMETLSNGTTVVTCTAGGQPLPKIEIQCDGHTARNSENLYTLDDVISVRGSCDSNYGSTWVTCQAGNGFTQDYESFYADQIAL